VHDTSDVEVERMQILVWPAAAPGDAMEGLPILSQEDCLPISTGVVMAEDGGLISEEDLIATLIKGVCERITQPKAAGSKR
jgi:hypothetical protein